MTVRQSASLCEVPTVSVRGSEEDTGLSRCGRAGQLRPTHGSWYINVRAATPPRSSWDRPRRHTTHHRRACAAFDDRTGAGDTVPACCSSCRGPSAGRPGPGRRPAPRYAAAAVRVLCRRGRRGGDPPYASSPQVETQTHAGAHVWTRRRRCKTRGAWSRPGVDVRHAAARANCVRKTNRMRNAPQRRLMPVSSALSAGRLIAYCCCCRRRCPNHCMERSLAALTAGSTDRTGQTTTSLTARETKTSSVALRRRGYM